MDSFKMQASKPRMKIAMMYKLDLNELAGQSRPCKKSCKCGLNRCLIRWRVDFIFGIKSWKVEQKSKNRKIKDLEIQESILGAVMSGPLYKIPRMTKWKSWFSSIFGNFKISFKMAPN